MRTFATFLKSLTALSLTFAFSEASFAQSPIPRTMAIQGQVTNIADDSYDVQLEIMDDGTSKQSFQVTGVQFQDGFFQIIIDTTNAGLLPDDFGTSTGQLFYRMTIDLDGGGTYGDAGDEVFDNIPIASVPAAMMAEKSRWAESAERLADQTVVPATAADGGKVLTWNDTSWQWEPQPVGGGSSVTLGSPSSSLLSLSGSELTLDEDTAAFDAGALNDYLLKRSGNTLVQSSIFDNGTSVGIGTSTPFTGYKLHVNGSIRSDGGDLIGERLLIYDGTNAVTIGKWGTGSATYNFPGTPSGMGSLLYYNGSNNLMSTPAPGGNTYLKWTGSNFMWDSPSFTLNVDDVDGSHIQDYTITNADIDPTANIDGSKLMSGSIQLDKLVNGSPGQVLVMGSSMPEWQLLPSNTPPSSIEHFHLDTLNTTPAAGQVLLMSSATDMTWGQIESGNIAPGAIMEGNFHPQITGAGGPGSITLGFQANVPAGNDNVTIGRNAANQGNSNSSSNTRANTVTIGAETDVFGNNATVVGAGADAESGGVAVGHKASAGPNAVALGHKALAAQFGIAIGQGANAPNGVFAVRTSGSVITTDPNQLELDGTGHLKVRSILAGQKALPTTNAVTVDPEQATVYVNTDASNVVYTLPDAGLHIGVEITIINMTGGTRVDIQGTASQLVHGQSLLSLDGGTNGRAVIKLMAIPDPDGAGGAYTGPEWVQTSFIQGGA